ncbi:hypothetical protein D0814_15630 [Vibrio parahaemolyticus]|nr:hypothetical protein [Vibrio parahaemolyticus]
MSQISLYMPRIDKQRQALVDERASLLRMRISYQRPDDKGWHKYQSIETEFVSLKGKMTWP